MLRKNVLYYQGIMAGYYNLAIGNSSSDPQYINGKPYWKHHTNDCVLWFNTYVGNWVFTSEKFLGCGKCYRRMIASNKCGLWPHEIKNWEYWNDVFSRWYHTTSVDVVKGMPTNTSQTNSYSSHKWRNYASDYNSLNFI